MSVRLSFIGARVAWTVVLPRKARGRWNGHQRFQTITKRPVEWKGTFAVSVPVLKKIYVMEQP